MSDLTREDWWRLKGPLACLLLVLVAIGVVFVTLNQLDTAAAAALRNARAQLNTARDDVAKIEQEEAAILENIGRYRELAADAVVQPEDRLQFLEQIAQLRAEHSLFPIEVSIDGQQTLPLEYPPTGREPGRPVSLHVSAVNLSLPLLHEDDLVRLLDELLQAPGVLQPQECQLGSRSPPGTNYIYLAQHFFATCSLLWYTLSVAPEPEVLQ